MHLVIKAFVVIDNILIIFDTLFHVNSEVATLKQPLSTFSELISKKQVAWMKHE